MSLRFICIEVRKNLHCANVFLQFDQSLTETEFLKIHVDNDAIRLKEYSTETCVKVQQHFAIEAHTMSNLIVEECNASFRITIDEFSDANTTTNPTAFPAKDSKPQLKIGEAITVLCKNCKCSLTAQQQFQRILQFPSGSIDMSEFFCHHGPDFGQVLVPQLQDIFYGFQFLVLNRNLLSEQTKEKENHLYCRRCLRYLGETLFDGKAAKIWSDNLLFKTVDSVDSEPRQVFEATTRTATCQLMHTIIRDCSVDNEPLHQIHFSKVLLEATFSNRQRRYLLLHILEKHLDVLRNEKPLAHGSIHNNNNVLQVKLEKHNCFKLLYCLIEEDLQQQGKQCQGEVPLLSLWKQDISIHMLKISSTLFSELLDELEENSLLLPELYRFSNGDFQLSYVFYIR